MIIPEKLEHCPQCGEGGSKYWLYDFQSCRSCGHDRMKVRFKPMKQTEIGRELMRDRGVAPDAWLVIKPNGKRDVLDAKEWDATSASFWLDGKPPEGTEIYPLYRTTPTTSE